MDWSMARLRAPEVGTVHRHCLICHRPFRVWRSQLTYRAGEFCTRECLQVSRRVFTTLLKDGRFEAMLAQVIEEERKKVA